MRVFLTGATGYIGSAIAAELLLRGHQVSGLARSEASAARLASLGVDPVSGDLADLAVLGEAASAADGVIHTGFSNISATVSLEDSTATDRAAVAAIGQALAGSGKPFVATSVTSLLRPGAVGTEDDPAWVGGNPRAQTEVDALAFAEQDVRVSAVRLPPSVHGPGDHGWIPALVRIARERGVAGYIGDGANRWAAVHRLDAAHLFCLALESAPAGARLHAVGDEAVTLHAIATSIARVADVPAGSIDPDDAAEHFGFLARFVALDGPRSSKLTRARLGWNPVHPDLLTDLDEGVYA
jgi:nucleoside-diphosphate-sugar epimerase